MKTATALIAALLLLASSTLAAEKPVPFVPAKADPLIGDWKSDSGPVAQVWLTPEGNYQANLLKAFDGEDKPIALLASTGAGDGVTLTGDGWSAKIAPSRFTATRGNERLEMTRVTRTSPMLGASPPSGAVVLFDGSNLDAWAKKAA